MWQVLLLYLMVFVLGATPFIEIMFVIPLGIGIGLNPILVGFVSFASNTLAIYLLVVGYKHFQQWWVKRRGSALIDPSDESWSTGRKARAMRLLQRYGVPVFALASPILISSHVGTIVSLLAGAPRHQIIWWMTLSLVLWATVTTIIAYFGIGFLTG